MLYFIVLVLSLATALLGFVSPLAYSVIWMLTIIPLLFVCFRRYQKPMPANRLFWLLTLGVTNFTVSVGAQLSQGDVLIAGLLGFFALFWGAQVIMVIRKMNGLNDDSPYYS